MSEKLFAVFAGAIFLFICFATLSPIEMRPETHHVGFERFAAFALLGLLTTFALPRRIVLVAFIVVLCAVGLEALQAAVPTRHWRISDGLVKAAGGLCGVLLANLVIWGRDRMPRSQ
jgi:VanZ family protein